MKKFFNLFCFVLCNATIPIQSYNYPLNSTQLTNEFTHLQQPYRPKSEAPTSYQPRSIKQHFHHARHPYNQNRHHTQLHNQNTTQTTFDAQRNAIAHALIEYRETCDIAQYYTPHNNAKTFAREQSFKALNDNSTVYTNTPYTLTHKTKSALKKCALNPNGFTSCYGNQLQQLIHQECINLLETTTTLPRKSILQPYKDSLYDITSAACDFNKIGQTVKAITLVDLCWVMLDCCSAVCEGAILGAVGAAHDLITHPTEALLSITASHYVFAFLVTKAVFEIANLGYTYIINKQAAKTRLYNYVEPLKQFVTACYRPIPMSVD